MREISHDIRSAVAQGAPLNPGPAEQLLLACDEAIQERDEARQVARQLTRWAPKNIRAEMQCYPWLKEEPGSQ